MVEVEDTSEKAIARDHVYHERSHMEKNAAMGHFPLISWRSIFAGFFVSLLVAAILLSLGLGFGGLSLTGMAANGTPDNGFALRSGIWFLVSGLIALFAGAYYAARISNFITSRIGSAQGLVIASLVFAVFFFQVVVGLGAAGTGFTGILGSLGGPAVDLTRNAQVQTVLNEVLNRNPSSDSTDQTALKSEPEVVAQGLAIRLLQGDDDGARNYLAYEAGITRAEADSRLARVSAQLQDAMKSASIAGARVVSGIGWSFFGILFLGTLFSALGGALGAKVNYRRPLARDIVQPAMSYTPSFQL